MKNNNYITGKMEYNFTYNIIPSAIFTNPIYKKISAEAKILYSVLLNRTKLSISSHFIDKQGMVYVFMTRDEAKDILNCGRNKATKTFKELSSVGLIDDLPQSHNKANIIYVKLPKDAKKDENKVNKNINAKKTYAQKQKDFLKKLNGNIKVKNKLLEMVNDKIKQTKDKINDYKTQKKKATKHISDSIKYQIEYEFLIENRKAFNTTKEFIDILVQSITEMKYYDTTKMHNHIHHKSELVEVIDKINSCDIIEFLDYIKRVGFDKINNLKSYLKTTIFSFMESQFILYSKENI